MDVVVCGTAKSIHIAAYQPRKTSHGAGTSEDVTALKTLRHKAQLIPLRFLEVYVLQSNNQQQMCYQSHITAAAAEDNALQLAGRDPSSHKLSACVCVCAELTCDAYITLH